MCVCVCERERERSGTLETVAAMEWGGEGRKHSPELCGAACAAMTGGEEVPGVNLYSSRDETCESLLLACALDAVGEGGGAVVLRMWFV